jgi:hypothetical protein
MRGAGEVGDAASPALASSSTHLGDAAARYPPGGRAPMRLNGCREQISALDVSLP